MPESRRIECYVRSLSPRSDHQKPEWIHWKLQQLASKGQITEYDFDIWGKAVAESNGSAMAASGRMLDRLDAIREWASQEGLSLKCFFETKTVTSGFTGETITETVLPTVTLMEFRDDELTLVTPSFDGERCISVEDHVARLEEQSQSISALPVDPPSRNEPGVI